MSAVWPAASATTILRGPFSVKVSISPLTVLIDALPPPALIAESSLLKS